jgi:hypothetical protein
MNSLTETISVKRWHAFVLLAMSGYAVGSIIAKAATALGL